MARRKSDKWRERVGAGVTKKTPQIIEKLRQAFATGLSVKDACTYAGISWKTYYNWINKDNELLQELELVQLNPILRASKAVINSLDDPDRAFRYLNAKRGDEYGSKTTVKHEGKIETEEIIANEGVVQAINTFNELMRQALTKKKQ